jgi:hypothetical protein
MRQPVREVLPGQHRAFGLGAMTAALVIVPVKPAGGARTTAGELPWMVRLSTAPGDITDTARSCPGSPGRDSSPRDTGRDTSRDTSSDLGRDTVRDETPVSTPAARRAPTRFAAVPAYRSAVCAF